MSARRPARFPGEPYGADRSFGPLVGLPDEIYFFVKAQRRERDARNARLVAAAAGPALSHAGAWGSSLAVRLHGLWTRLTRTRSPDQT